MATYHEVARVLGGADDREKIALERVVAQGFHSLMQECRHLRARLERNHVFYDNAQLQGLDQQLLIPTSQAFGLLKQGFHRLVVLDAAEGLLDDEFDLEIFLQHIQEKMVEQFGLPIPEGSYHPETIIQVLKDEPCSLFCFVNVQLIPIGDLRRLRGFTQEKHQALLLCAGARALASEEEGYDSWTSDGSYVLEMHHGSCLGRDEATGMEKHHGVVEENRIDWRYAEDLPTLYNRLTELYLWFFSADRSMIIEIEGPDMNVRSSQTNSVLDQATLLSSHAVEAVARKAVDVRRGFTAVAKERGKERSVLAHPLVRPNREVDLLLFLEKTSRDRCFTNGHLRMLREAAVEVVRVRERIRRG